MDENQKLKEEHAAYKYLYERLFNYFNTVNDPSSTNKIDFVKARVFSAMININKINQKS